MILAITVIYVIGLAASAIVLLVVAATRFATTSPVDRVLAALGGTFAAYYAFHLATTGRGLSMVFYGAVLIPIFAGRKLVQGFRRREQDRAERAAAEHAIRAAEDWRSVRRW
ncbi:hypothetical protein [Micromonospora coxensis]|uniref:Uncharacterized protein n=1 Tax=Micromonospora coxensis TaxID=356852 RepID=A0A1C5HFE3_9ACTN|nr:hypothetical protein [Micromonospora coxensis]SCG44241.1 hypothetical protein GA0070614_1189 [Micromonospora coxensis]